MVRMRPGVTVDAVQRRIDGIQAELAKRAPPGIGGQFAFEVRVEAAGYPVPAVSQRAIDAAEVLLELELGDEWGDDLDAVAGA